MKLWRGKSDVLLTLRCFQYSPAVTITKNQPSISVVAFYPMFSSVYVCLCVCVCVCAVICAGLGVLCVCVFGHTDPGERAFRRGDA